MSPTASAAARTARQGRAQRKRERARQPCRAPQPAVERAQAGVRRRSPRRSPARTVIAAARRIGPSATSSGTASPTMTSATTTHTGNGARARRCSGCRPRTPRTPAPRTDRAAGRAPRRRAPARPTCAEVDTRHLGAGGAERLHDPDLAHLLGQQRLHHAGGEHGAQREAEQAEGEQQEQERLHLVGVRVATRRQHGDAAHAVTRRLEARLQRVGQLADIALVERVGGPPAAPGPTRPIPESGGASPRPRTPAPCAPSRRAEARARARFPPTRMSRGLDAAGVPHREICRRPARPRRGRAVRSSSRSPGPGGQTPVSRVNRSSCWASNSATTLTSAGTQSPPASCARRHDHRPGFGHRHARHAPHLVHHGGIGADPRPPWPRRGACGRTWW